MPSTDQEHNRHHATDLVPQEGETSDRKVIHLARIVVPKKSLIKCFLGAMDPTSTYSTPSLTGVMSIDKMVRSKLATFTTSMRQKFRKSCEPK